VRFEIDDSSLLDRVRNLTANLGHAELTLRSYPHPNSYVASRDVTIGIYTSIEGATQAASERVDQVISADLPDEVLRQRIEHLAGRPANADDAHHDLETLQSLIRAMVTSRDPAVILRRMSKALAERIAFTRSSILLFNLDEGRAQIITANDRNDDSGAPIHLEIGKYPELIRLIQTRSTVVINDTTLDPMMTRVQKDLAGTGVGAALLFPLLFEGVLIGCVFLRRSTGLEGPSREALRFGEIVSGACATALHTARVLRNARNRQVQATRARMLAESKLKDYERFEEFFDYASDGMAVLDEHGRFVSVNPEGRRILGFSETELRERPLSQMVSPKEQMTIHRVVRGFSHRIFPRNLQVRIINGRKRERVISLSAGGLGGESRGVILSFRDVTEATMMQRELTATKDFLENLVSRSGDGIISARLDGEVILFNGAAEKILQTAARAVLHRPKAETLFERGGWRALIETLRSNGGVITGLQQRMRRADGNTVEVRMGATLLFENEDEAAVVMQVHDLSEELSLKAQIDQKIAQASEIQGALLMAATAAHELNQPLTTIVGFADMAMAQLEADHRARLAIERIITAAERLSERVSGLGRLKRIVTRSYGDGAEIVDLEASTRTQLPFQREPEEENEPEEITQTTFVLPEPAATLGPEDAS